AFTEELVIVSSGQGMRMSQKFDTGGRDTQRTSENKRSDGIRSNDDRNQGEKRVVYERATIDGNLIETKNTGNQSCESCMESKEWGEGNENTERKSKRRTHRWIIQSEQTAKGGTKHKKAVTSER